jgi:hypothetical protein
MKSSRSNYVAARLFGILALVVFGTGGCKSHETPEQQAQARLDPDVANYQEQIRKVVQDPFRAEELVALVSDFEKLAREAAIMVRENQAKLAALNANPPIRSGSCWTNVRPPPAKSKARCSRSRRTTKRPVKNCWICASS